VGPHRAVVSHVNDVHGEAWIHGVSHNHKNGVPKQAAQTFGFKSGDISLKPQIVSTNKLPPWPLKSGGNVGPSLTSQLIADSNKHGAFGSPSRIASSLRSSRQNSRMGDREGEAKALKCWNL
jgi:hypothetical protein